MRGLPGATAVQAGESGAFLSADGSETWATGCAPVGTAGWAVVVRESLADALGPMARFSVLSPILVILAALVSLVAVYLILTSVIRPLRKLGAMAERVAWGDFAAAERPALSTLTEQVGALAGAPKISFTAEGEMRRLRSEVEVALFRSVQEALNNARQHALAGRVDITLRCGDEEVAVTVTDDGRGFDAPKFYGGLTTSGTTRWRACGSACSLWAESWSSRRRRTAGPPSGSRFR